MFKKKGLDYSVPSAVQRQVYNEFDNYEFYTAKAQEEVYDDMSLIGSSFPSGIYISKTNAISRPTEEIYFANYDAHMEIANAKEKKRAIDAGFSRAAMTAQSTGEVRDLEKDLKRHFIYSVPNTTKDYSGIGRDRKSFAQYKRKAIYFVAVELGLIQISEEIERAEALKGWRSKGAV